MNQNDVKAIISSLEALANVFPTYDQALRCALDVVHNDVDVYSEFTIVDDLAFVWAHMAGRWPVPTDILDKVCDGELAPKWQEHLSILMAVQALIGPERLGLRLICVPPWFDPYRHWSRGDPAEAADSSRKSTEMDPVEKSQTEEIEEESELTFGQTPVPNRRHNRRPN